MSQVTLTTTTTPLPVTVVCSGAILITMTDMLDPTFVGQITMAQHNVVLLPQLDLRATVRGLLASPLWHRNNNLSPRFILRHMPTMPWSSRDEFLFQSLAFQLIYYVICWCLLWCLLSIFGFTCGCHVQ